MRKTTVHLQSAVTGDLDINFIGLLIIQKNKGGPDKDKWTVSAYKAG
jgi:hypothetical protein